MAAKKKAKKKAVKEKAVKKKAKKKTKKVEEDIVEELTHNNPKTLAVIYLLLNVLILPGLGTILSKRTTEGIWQLILVFLAIVVSYIYINLGLIILAIAWVWALISSISILKNKHMIHKFQ